MGHLEQCRVLIECGANINAVDQSKCKPDVRGIGSNNTHNTNGADEQNASRDTTISTCNNNQEHTPYAAASKISRVVTGDTALHYAIQAGNYEMCEFLVRRGIDINIVSSSGKPIVHFACSLKKYKICSFLIDQGADINELEFRNVTIQVHQKLQPQVQWTESITYSETALQSAALRGNVETCEFLVSKGADLNLADSTFGNTALHIACNEGYLDVCEVLINNGADIDIKNSYFDSSSESNREDTALHVACMQGHLDVCQFLIDRGADVTITNRLNLDIFEVADKEIVRHLKRYWQKVQDRIADGLGRSSFSSTTGSPVRNNIRKSTDGRSMTNGTNSSSSPFPPSSPAAGMHRVNSGLSNLSLAAGDAMFSSPPASPVAEMSPPPAPFVGCGRTWKEKKVKFSIRKSIFKRTIWEMGALLLKSSAGKGAWVSITPTTNNGRDGDAINTILLHGIHPVEMDVGGPGKRPAQLDLRLVFKEPGAKYPFLKLSFGTNRAVRDAWKAAFKQHLEYELGWC